MSRGGRVGKHKLLYVWGGGGGMAEVRWAGTLLSKDHPLVGIHINFVLARTRKKPKCAAFNYTNSLIGDIAMVIHM